MAIEIREARAGELEEVARVLGAAFEQYRPQGFEGYLRDVANVRSRVGLADLFVAVEAGRVVGTATLYRPNPPHSDRQPWPRAWASLRLLAVEPSHRGRGIGRMLTDARLRRARELGAPVVVLHTTELFEVSRSMYRRMGWQRAPEYDHWPLPGLCAEAYVLALDVG